MTERLLVFAPNWLGDAVMALPALADVRASLPATTIDVAARPSVAPLFSMVEGVARVVTLARRPEDAAALREGRYDAALLLPNSFNVARIAWSAGISERWGVRRDVRSLLLTRAVPAPVRVHQAEYYRQIVHDLGMTATGGALRVAPSTSAQEAGVALLKGEGWDGRMPLVALAPGAAFGGAKRWPAASFASVVDRLSATGVRSVLIGTAADGPAIHEVLSLASSRPQSISLVGRTDLPTLAAVLVQCRALITNDSGAMHLASALGVAVTAMFGPTIEQETSPIGPGCYTVLTHDVWCRPCMLRECPLTQRCMTGITPDAVVAATTSMLGAQ